MIKRVFQKPNGEIVIMTFCENTRRFGETELQFMNRQTEKLPYRDLPFFDIDSDDMPTDRLDREKWRIMDDNGKKIVKVDPIAPSPRKDAIKRKQNVKISANAKLKTLGFTDDEIGAIVP